MGLKTMKGSHGLHIYGNNDGCTPVTSELSLNNLAPAACVPMDHVRDDCREGSSSLAASVRTCK
jgi:hypothetical protein